LHFDMQVPTRLGWVFVNPYMTLVAAYERLIGARGTEIKAGDAVPDVAGVPPVIQHLEPLGATAHTTATQTDEPAAASAKPHRDVESPHKKRRHVRKRGRHDAS